MFDFHIHSHISFDGHNTPYEMAESARGQGLKEICFTDHMDFAPGNPSHDMAFFLEDYRAAYDGLHLPGIQLRRGVEYGLTPDNPTQMTDFLQQYPFDYVIGSIHFVDGKDPYFQDYWEGRTLEQAELAYFEGVLRCLRVHEDFDCLGHLTYIGKTRPNPVKRPVPYHLYKEVVDEALTILADKGKGLELNTSGMRRCGAFLPELAYLRRFRELGGRIVTVGSDSHRAEQVGSCCREAVQAVQELFGYVCTFAQRQPVFHKTIV